MVTENFIEFKIYGNESFKENIFLPVTALSKSVVDTSELFMRSLQMYNMFMDTRPAQKPVHAQQKAKVTLPPTVNNTDELKVGELVRTSFSKLIKNDQITYEMIEWLSSKKYCKDTFDVNYPILKKLASGFPIGDQRNVNGYPRYWAEVLTIKGEKYILCNDWYDRNRRKFETWFENIKTSETKPKKRTPFSFFK